MGLFKKEIPLFAVLDIGSASVGGALVECSPNPSLKFSIRERIPFQAEFSKTRFLADIIKAQRKVLAELVKNSEGRSPKQVHIIVSSPWYVGQSRSRFEKRDTPFVVTKELVTELEKKEVAAFEKDMQKLHPTIFGSGFTVLEIKTTGIKLNGYATDKPYGESVKELELSFFVSLIGSEVQNLFKETAIGSWHHEEIVFHSHPTAITHVLESLYPSTNSYLIFDVLGEVTDAITVRDHVVKDTASVPLGSHHLVRLLAGSLSTTPEDVNSLIHAYQTQALAGDRKVQFESALNTFKQPWIEKVKVIFESLSRDLLLPEKAYIVGSSDASQLFASFLADPALASFSSSGGPLDVVHINTESVCQFCDIGKGNRDPLLGLEGIYVSRVQSPQHNPNHRIVS